MALEGVKDGYVEALISPEHWLKGYLAVKLMADAKQNGKPLPEGMWNSGALTVNADNIDEIIARQKDAASRAAYFKDEVAKQLGAQDQYLQPDADGLDARGPRLSARPTAASSRSPARTSRSAPGRCTRCWARTARASRRS